MKLHRLSPHRPAKAYRLLALVVSSAVLLPWPGLALAERRVALVIGNSAYETAPALANPRNDAEDIGTVLRRLGFDTTVALDADRGAMEKAIEEFAGKTDAADVALFYYAGHGLQYQGVNYLVPTDANLQSATGLRRLTRLNDVVADVKRAKALRILVLDACRDNPFAEALDAAAAQGEPSRKTRSTGLAKLTRSAASPAAVAPQGDTPAGGDIVVYAAEAGRTAADGQGRNSPFTSAVLKNIETEGQEVVALMRRVAINVQQETKGEQRPELLLSVPFEFYFRAGAQKPPPTVQQLVPEAKTHDVAAIEAEIARIVEAAPAADRDQVRREAMVLLSDVASRSNLKPQQIVTELPRAYARLKEMRQQIRDFRNLVESEPGIAPFVEIAAAAVASGRSPDLAAADQALAQAQSRYDDAIKVRSEAIVRAKANRASLAEQRGHIAETELRSKDAAALYLAAAQDTAAEDVETAVRRFAMAGSALSVHGINHFANDSLREAIRLLEAEALKRLEQGTPANDEQKRAFTVLNALILAQIADSQTQLGGRLPGYEGAKLMVDARATYGRALKSFEIGSFPSLAMDIMDRRSQRDLEFGRRILKDRGRGHFEEAVKTMRLILKIQDGKPAFANDLGRTRNNLANALKELSKRVDGEEGAAQISETVTLLEQSIAVLEQQRDPTNVVIARTNLAHALTLKAARSPGMSGASDMNRARSIYDDLARGIDAARNPRIWAIVKRHEAELLRLMGEREADSGRAFASLKTAFETYQKILPVTSRETAPNDWATLCAEMGYTIVAVLPHIGGSDRERFAKNAIGLFGNASAYFTAGGFGQDLERVNEAKTKAEQALAAAAPTQPTPGTAPGKQQKSQPK